jgi:hypothetical protein
VQTPPEQRGGRRAATIALGYGISTAAYIVLSSIGLEPLDSSMQADLEMLKGIGFVVLTSGLLWWLIRRPLGSLLRAQVLRRAPAKELPADRPGAHPARDPRSDRGRRRRPLMRDERRGGRGDRRWRSRRAVRGDDSEAGEIGTIALGVAGEQSHPLDRGMRADVEVG